MSAGGNQKGIRQQRVGDLLLAFLAEEVRTLRDPRVKQVTITGIDVSKDYRHAVVYWSTTLPDDALRFPASEEVADIQKALEGAEGRLKKRIGSELTLRYIPALHFKYDASAETGSRIDKLLRDAGISS